MLGQHWCMVERNGSTTEGQVRRLEMNWSEDAEVVMKKDKIRIEQVRTSEKWH